MFLTESIINTFIFLAVISVLIVTHEYGHFIVARLRGIRVEKFAIGFGPVILKKKIGVTELLICLIPLGGYVRLAGDQRDETSGQADEFYSKSPLARAQVVFAGPLFNYVFSFLIFWFLFTVGMPERNYLDTPVVGGVVEGAPADAAGIQEQDIIKTIDGQPVSTWDDIPEMIRTSSGAVAVSLERAGRIMEFEIVPETKPAHDMFGRRRESVRQIGIARASEVVITRYNIFPAVFQALKKVFMLTVFIFQGLYYIVTGAIPVQEGLAGPIALYQLTSDIAQQGLRALLSFVAAIGVMLTVVNLLPIPVLDGGHIFLLFIEKLRKKPLSEKAENILGKIGVALLGMIMLFVVYNDIMRIVAKG